MWKAITWFRLCAYRIALNTISAANCENTNSASTIQMWNMWSCYMILSSKRLFQNYMIDSPDAVKSLMQSLFQRTISLRWKCIKKYSRFFAVQCHIQNVMYWNTIRHSQISVEVHRTLNPLCGRNLYSVFPCQNAQNTSTSYLNY